jgi:CNT family concentrative nucleoside transporter
MNGLRGLLALPVILGLVWLISEDRRHPRFRVIVAGLSLQIGLALVLLKFQPATALFLSLNAAVEALQTATDAGTAFVFGYLGGGPAPYDVTRPNASFILAFRALPLVLVISALASLMLYVGILQKIVGALAFALRRTLGVGGALGLGAAVHIFVGMVEAPLLVRPYLNAMSRGELLALMTCGLAGVAGTVMVIYAGILGPVIPNALGNILIASVISTPAALAIAAVMIPFGPTGAEDARLKVSDLPASALEAIARGVEDGVKILANIIAMLIVLVALVSLANIGLAALPHRDAPLTLQVLFSFPFRPLMWLIGIPWEESRAAAALMSSKTVLNEFIAFIDLANLPPDALSPRSRLIMTYALCGFANFGSLGILIGGLTTMAPERKHDIVALGFRAMIAGTLATCMSGAVVGALI